MADFLRKLGQVVGIGVGELQILLVKPEVAAGETVHGRAILKLTEPLEAKRIVVGVEATEERSGWRTDDRGTRIRTTETVVVHKFEQQLDGRRLYRTQDEAWDFHLPLPGEERKVELPGGVLGDVARLVTVVAAATRKPVRWRVFGVLEIPWKANVKGGADLVVR